MLGESLPIILVGYVIYNENQLFVISVMWVGLVGSITGFLDSILVSSN